MCQTGGPRCYNESRPAVVRAQTAYFEAVTEAEHIRDARPEGQTAEQRAEAHNAAPEQRNAAAAAYLTAMGDLYASPRGKEEIDAWYESGTAFPFSLEKVQSAAEYQKRRGKIVRGILAAENGDFTAVLGQTGDGYTDPVVAVAAREYAAEYALHDRAPEGIPGVKQYATAEEKVRGVERWARGVREAAMQFHQAGRRLSLAQEDVALIAEGMEGMPETEETRQRIQQAQAAVAPVERDLRDARTRLMVMADKLRIAKSRQVPGGGVHFPETAPGDSSLGAYLDRTGQMGAWVNETMQMADQMRAAHDRQDDSVG